MQHQSAAEPSEMVARFIDELLALPDVVPAEAAGLLDDRMRSEHPDAHALFLQQHSRYLYHSLLSKRYRSQRHSVRTNAATFARAAGDREALSVFTIWRCRIDDGGTQRQIGETTGRDHRYIADCYERDSQTTAMLATFHRQVAKRIGTKRVADVFTEEKFLQMYQSITGAEAPLELAA